MPKGAKSSASAGTRKKHAKKAHKDSEEGGQQAPQQHKKLQRGQKKLSKAQQRALPKVKQYIPPPKPPAPPIPDPLDGQGLARTLPAELVIVLRRLGKKDEVTRRKGLDELRDEWITEVTRATTDENDAVEKELKEVALISAMPVWVSHFHRDLLIVAAQSGKSSSITLTSNRRPAGTRRPPESTVNSIVYLVFLVPWITPRYTKQRRTRIMAGGRSGGGKALWRISHQMLGPFHNIPGRKRSTRR